MALASGWHPRSDRVVIATLRGRPAPERFGMINTASQPADFDPVLVIDAQRHGARVVLGVAGEVDLYTAPRLAAALNAALAANEPAGEVVVDLGRVSFCDARGLAVLAGAHRQALRADKRLVLARPSRMLRRLLAITGLAQVLCVEEEATRPYG